MRAFSEVVDGEMDFRELSMGYGLWVERRVGRTSGDEARTDPGTGEGARGGMRGVRETTDEKVLAIRIK